MAGDHKDCGKLVYTLSKGCDSHWLSPVWSCGDVGLVLPYLLIFKEKI